MPRKAGRPRPRPKDAPPPEAVEALARAGEVIGRYTHLPVRRVWIDEGPDASCPLCDVRELHTEELHYGLLNARARRLARSGVSKVRLAERTYRKATGRRWTMERTLWHEFVTERKTVREVAAILGISWATSARWARRIGIELPDYFDGVVGSDCVNEYEG